MARALLTNCTNTLSSCLGLTPATEAEGGEEWHTCFVIKNLDVSLEWWLMSVSLTENLEVHGSFHIRRNGFARCTLEQTKITLPYAYNLQSSTGTALHRSRWASWNRGGREPTDCSAHINGGQRHPRNLRCNVGRQTVSGVRVGQATR